MGVRSVVQAMRANHGAAGWACKAAGRVADLARLTRARRSLHRDLVGAVRRRSRNLYTVYGVGRAAARFYSANVNCYKLNLSNRSPVFPRGTSPQARGVTRGHGPLYEEDMDLDVVVVGDGECPRSGAQHHGLARPLRFNSLSARSRIPTVATSVSLKTESRMGSPAMAVHVPTFLTAPAEKGNR